MEPPVKRAWPALPVVLYLALALPVQVWAALDGPLRRLNYGHGWMSFVAYGIGAPCGAYLLWRGHPRARMAAYVFLAFDAARSLRLEHRLPLVLDLALLLYLQAPPLRRLYPSMWSRTRRWRRGSSTS